jgi:hypothetical protein
VLSRCRPPACWSMGHHQQMANASSSAGPLQDIATARGRRLLAHVYMISRRRRGSWELCAGTLQLRVVEGGQNALGPSSREEDETDLCSLSLSATSISAVQLRSNGRERPRVDGISLTVHLGTVNTQNIDIVTYSCNIFINVLQRRYTETQNYVL